MILKGSQRAGAKQLAAHLLNDRDNDHVQVLDIRGFVSDDLAGAFTEAYAISKATQCKQFLFSLSLSPPEKAIASEADFISAVDRAEAKLGLDGQPRAVVIHEKEGRRHAHAVWSRIDAESITAINLPHFKIKLTDLSKELYLDHGWELPKGLRTHGGKSPLNFTLAEWQQAKRQNVDPREIKQIFQQAWDCSDSLQGLGNALAEHGYFIAKGDRRGIVALDVNGEVYSFTRWSGVKSKDVKSRIADVSDMPSVQERRVGLRGRVSDQMRDFIGQVKAKQSRDLKPLLDEKSAMVREHRSEREHLQISQDNRWTEESRIRAARFKKGLHGLFDWVTGRAKALRQENEKEAYLCSKRDATQRDDLVRAQMMERQTLQDRIKRLKSSQKQERRILGRDIADTLKSLQSEDNQRSLNRSLHRDLSISI